MELSKNVIMDNTGGSGVEIRSVLFYFPPSELADNTIRNNGSGSITITTNKGKQPVIRNNNLDNMDPKWQNENFSHAYPYVSDPGTIRYKEFIPVKEKFSTIIRQERKSQIPQLVPGMVIKTGIQWSIIKKVDGDMIEIWGLISAPTDDMTIMPLYK